MRLASRFSSMVLTAGLLLGACSPAEKPADESEMSPPAEMAAMASVGDFAGMWTGEATLEGTPNPVTFSMTVNATGESTMTLEGRPAIPLTVSMSGDSLVAVTAEYESVLRAGVMVTTRTASVMDAGMMRGSMVATYNLPDGQQMVRGTVTASRAP